jgi:hypothetical protein
MLAPVALARPGLWRLFAFPDFIGTFLAAVVHLAAKAVRLALDADNRFAIWMHVAHLAVRKFLPTAG